MLALLLQLKNQGIGIIHVTHNMEEAAIADRVIVMNQGEIVADGSPRNILSRVDWLKSLNLAPPKITELIWELNQAGIKLETNIFSIKEAAEKIAALSASVKDSINCNMP